MSEKAWQGMNWIRTSTRCVVYAACGFRCVYCGLDAAGTRRRGSFGLDHLIPRAHGGGNGLANVAMACKGCNTKKGDRDVDTFLAELADEGHHVDAIRARIETVQAVTRTPDRALGRTLARAWERGASLATLAKRARAGAVATA